MSIIQPAPIPENTEYLIVTCHPAGQPLFNGIEAICRLLAGQNGFYLHSWDNKKLKLTDYPKLSTVILSGHGKEQKAGLIAGWTMLPPAGLKLPALAELYLISCYQGKPMIRETWAKKTGLPPNRVFGYEDEAEIVLSTLFFIQLYDQCLTGLPHVATACGTWQRANRYLQPFFSLIREIYKKNRFNILPALEEMEKIINLNSFSELVKIAKTYPKYLSGLHP